ncbi:MAG TPA: hypothetical protein PKC79_13795 [Solidesulfovibrio magneticus]|nr:hypothetical protein [Solidesulfovibrio magneticus]
MRLCALILAMSLLPAPVMAASWSFSTPYGSTSGSLDPNAVTVSSSGSLSVSSTLLDWSFTLDKPTTSLSGSATVNGQAYSGSFDWSDLFAWLFG